MFSGSYITGKLLLEIKGVDLVQYGKLLGKKKEIETIMQLLCFSGIKSVHLDIASLLS